MLIFAPLTSQLPQLRGKAMADKAGDMLDIARDILLTARLDDRERFKQVGLSWIAGGGCSWLSSPAPTEAS